MKEARTEEFRRLYLDPLKQSGEEIGDEESVRKDQCPTGDPL